jgi:hypothetical protein
MLVFAMLSANLQIKKSPAYLAGLLIFYSLKLQAKVSA